MDPRLGSLPGHAIIPDIVFKGVLALCLGLFICGELMYGKLFRKNILEYFCIVFFVAICLYLHFANLSFVILVVFFGRNTDFKHICQTTIIVTAIGLGVVFISAKIGLITDYYGYRGDGTKRSYLGFRYPLFAPGFLVNMLVAYIYISNAKITVLKGIAIAAFSYLVFSITDARLSFLLSISMIVMVFLYQWGKKHTHRKSIIHKLMIPIFPAFTVVSLIITMLYSANDYRWRFIDSILAKRLQYGQRSLLLYGVKLFGNANIDWAGFSIGSDGTLPIYTADMVYVDNVYIHILQRYGIVFTLLVLITLTHVMVILYKKKDYVLQMLFALFAIHGLIDNQVIYVCFNVLLFAMFIEIHAFYNWPSRKKSVPRE